MGTINPDDDKHAVIRTETVDGEVIGYNIGFYTSDNYLDFKTLIMIHYDKDGKPTLGQLYKS